MKLFTLATFRKRWLYLVLIGLTCTLLGNYTESFHLLTNRKYMIYILKLSDLPGNNTCEIYYDVRLSAHNSIMFLKICGRISFVVCKCVVFGLV